MPGENSHRRCSGTEAEEAGMSSGPDPTTSIHLIDLDLILGLNPAAFKKTTEDGRYLLTIFIRASEGTEIGTLSVVKIFWLRQKPP